MKKAYIAPNMIAVAVKMEKLLQNSNLNGQQGQDNVSVDLSDSEYQGGAAANGSSSFWDDED